MKSIIMSKHLPVRARRLIFHLFSKPSPAKEEIIMVNQEFQGMQNLGLKNQMPVTVF